MAKRKNLNDYLLFRRNQFLKELMNDIPRWSDDELGALVGLTRQQIFNIRKEKENVQKTT